MKPGASDQLRQTASGVICVLGVMRSGTSLLARVLQSNGVYFGEPENLTGYDPIEHEAFRQIDASVLARYGGSLTAPPRAIFTPGWGQLPELQDIRDLARQQIEKYFEGHDLWGWKTPSTTLTLPFWQSVVPDLRCVIAVRNPIDVIESYHRMRGLPAGKTLRLWQLYNALAIEGTRGEPRLIVFFRDWMESRESSLASMLRFLSRDQPAAETAAEQLVDRRRWHHRSRPEDLLRDKRISGEAACQYLLLRTLSRQANGEVASVDPEIDSLARALHGRVQSDYLRRLGSPTCIGASRLSALLGPLLPLPMRHRLAMLRERLLWP